GELVATHVLPTQTAGAVRQYCKHIRSRLERKHPSTVSDRLGEKSSEKPEIGSDIENDIACPDKDSNSAQLWLVADFGVLQFFQIVPLSQKLLHGRGQAGDD